MVTLASEPTAVQNLALLHLTLGNFVLAVMCAWAGAIVAKPFRSSLAAWMFAVYGTSWIATTVVWLVMWPALRHLLAAAEVAPLRYGWTVLWLLTSTWIVLVGIGHVAFWRWRGRVALSRAPATLMFTAVAIGVQLVVLVPLYAAFSRSGLLRLELAAVIEVVSVPQPEWVYFASEEDGQLWRVSLDGRRREFVAPLQDARLSDRVEVSVPVPGDGAIEVIGFTSHDRYGSKALGEFVMEHEVVDHLDPTPSARPNAIPVVDGAALRIERSNRGLGISHADGSALLELAADVPFLAFDDSWYSDELDPISATLTSGGLVVFQTGSSRREIYVLDPMTRCYALLAKGRPALVLSNSPRRFEPFR